jgi:ABC-type transporter Mla subunit MlaD
MKTDRNAIFAGLFMLTTVAVLCAIVVGIKGYERLFETRNSYIVRFKLADDIGGLSIGDDVRVGGAKAGVVRNIDVIQTEADPAIVVHFTMPRRFDVRSDARIVVQGTLTGTSWLNFETLGRGESIQPGQWLVGNPSAFTRLLNSASDVAPDLAAIVKDVRAETVPKVNSAVDEAKSMFTTFRTTGETTTSLVQRVDGKVEGVVEKYNETADAAKGAMRTLDEILGDTKSDIRGTLANLNSATASIKDRLPKLLDQFSELLTKVDASVVDARETLLDVKAIASDTRATVANARSLLANNRSRIDGMIASLKATSDNLKNASAEIRRSPWRLLYQPKPGEIANLTLYDSARQFAEGANDLNDAASALRDALTDPTIDPAKLKELLDKLDKSFGQFQKVEGELWNRVQR